MQQPYSFGYLSKGRGDGPDFGSSSLLSQNGPYRASLGSYSGTNMADSKAFDSSYLSPDVGYGSYSDGYGGSVGASEGYGAFEGYGADGYVGASQDEDWNARSATGYDDETPESVFSDVSDLEPVYSFSSRSRYQQGRAVFAQTRYTPGEPFFPPMPVARRISKTTFEENRPDAPAKGLF